MSGETIRVARERVLLIPVMGSIANNAISAYNVNSLYDVEYNGGGFPDGDFVLYVKFAAAPVEGSTFNLHAQYASPDGYLNAEVSEISRPTRLIGSFVLNDTLEQTIVLPAYDLPRKAYYQLHNNGSGQATTLVTLSVVPRSYAVAE